MWINLCMLICYAISIAWGVYGLSLHLGLFFCIPPFLFLLGSNYLFNKWISNFKARGTVYFDAESLTISAGNETTIPYSQIKRLYFKVGLQGISASKYRYNPHAYILQISTAQDNYVVTVERKLFLTEEDHLLFSRGYPDIIGTLTELQKAYGFPAEEKESKIKFEGIVCAAQD